MSLLAGLGIFVVIVVVGTIAMFVVARVRDPKLITDGLLVGQLVLNAVAAFAAGFATARMTWGRSLYTVILLAVILSVSSLVPLLQHASTTLEPIWYLQWRPALVLLGVLAGAFLERRGSNSRQTPG
jgi:hypothetical protein